MANCMIGFPNNIDLATVSGGSYVAALPITNLQTREVKEFARTNNLLDASCIINIDQGTIRAATLASVINHNFSINSQFRFRASNDVTFATSTLDTGVIDVWPVVYPYGTLPWEHPSFFGGRYTTEELEGYIPNLSVLFGSTILCRYFRFEFFDPDNDDGYLQYGRVFVGPGWQPTINMSWGQSLGWETRTTVQESLAGSETFDVRIPFRVDRFRLDGMTRNEAMTNAFEIQRRAGIDKEIMWIEDTEDNAQSIRTRYLGRIRVLSPIEFPQYNVNKTAFEIKEIQ